mmetsp:Transcript_18815/g.44685  ORF Transcript_18815/g.44685 Transcript_18815/m.44685 type:complete len:177 (-) Transcript_18815:119-649(-)
MFTCTRTCEKARHSYAGKPAATTAEPPGDHQAQNTPMHKSSSVRQDRGAARPYGEGRGGEREEASGEWGERPPCGQSESSADRDASGLRQWRHLGDGARGGLGMREDDAAFGPAREGSEVGEHGPAPVGVAGDGVVLDAVAERDTADAVDERHVAALEHEVVDVRARPQPRLTAEQ